jgi:hypothetical protein
VSLNFIHNFFKGLRGKPVACAACTGRYLKKPRLAMTSHFTPFLLDIFMLYFPVRLFSLSLSFCSAYRRQGPWCSDGEFDSCAIYVYFGKGACASSISAAS